MTGTAVGSMSIHGAAVTGIVGCSTPRSGVDCTRGLVNVFASVVVIERDGLFLAVGRKGEPCALGFPGGKLEPGETPEAAAVRELEEETGLLVAAASLTPLYVGVDETGKVCAAFLASSFQGVASSREGARVGWVEPMLLLPGSQSPFGLYNRAVLERYRSLPAPASSG